MTAREVIAALLSATSSGGYDNGENVLVMPSNGVISYRRVGGAVHVRLDPPAEVAKSGLIGAVANGEIRRAEITHEGVRVWIEGVAILGTVEREYRV